MNNTHPKAIFFDLDETLVENRIPIQTLFARMYFDFESQLGAENKELFFDTLRKNAGELWQTMFEQDDSPEQQFVARFKRSIAATKSVPEQQQERLANDMFERFLMLSHNNVVFHDGAEETLKELSKQGYITGIITNGIEQVQLGKIQTLDLQNKVDHVIVSAQARAHKPLPAVFKLALSRANIDAHQAWQIGDHATNDVAGAIRAGMGGIFYDPSNKRLNTAFTDLEERPTHTIKHHSDLFKLLAM